MSKRGIVLGAGILLIALSGCATHQRTDVVARSTEADVRPSALPADLVGTWSGSVMPVAPSAGGSNAVGSVTITIKDDGTYTATDRRGASTRNYSGVVVAKGRSITFRNSSGRSVSLRRRGDALYGVAQDMSGYALQISVQKDSGALAGSPPAENGR